MTHPLSVRPLPSEADLRKLVAVFYAEVRVDGLLGPIFSSAVDDWDGHVDRVTAFWSSVLLGSGRYKGNPFGAHLAFRDQLGAEHFERWLELWCLTARRTFEPDVAELVEFKARRIAESLRAGLLFRLGTPPLHEAMSTPA